MRRELSPVSMVTALNPGDNMPEDRTCQLLQSSRSPDVRKKKRKKRKKAITSSPSENRVKPQGVSSLPENLQVSTLPPEHLDVSQACLPENTTSRTKDGEHFNGRAQGYKKHLKGSPSLLRLTRKTGGSGGQAQGNTADDGCMQARESLRWEGVLEDLQAEEKRLQLYRANRRQRYVSHREALLKEVQQASGHSENRCGVDFQEKNKAA
ncbi:hypothetical protein D4764_14G0010640 [Takifugu flavidus]|uniref:Protein LIAT1 n=1 Tax=Takifugu flavidus TaxID=433684 RepID=A0A5C6P884_9TELE|nr:hypothetical protein D4764_14G0010640 [Takifugu flavidus]